MKKNIFYIFIIFIIFSVNADQKQDIITSSGALATAKRLDELSVFLKDKKSFSETEEYYQNENSLFSSILPYENTDIFYLKDLIFNNSNFISDDYAENIRKRYIGRKISVMDLKFIINQINLRYYKLGKTFVKAVFDNRNILEGVVRIYFVEPRIGKVNILNNKTTKSDFVKENTGIIENSLFDMNFLNKNLLRVNYLMDYRARISLKPGKEFATTDIDIKVSEPEKYSNFMTLDNSGKDETGSSRMILNSFFNSLSGERDNMVLSTVYSEGSLDNMLTYSFYKLNGNKSGITLRNTDTEIVSGSLNTFDIESKMDSWGYFYKKNILLLKNEIRNVKFTIESSDSKTYFNSSIGFKSNISKLNISWDRLKYINGGYIFTLNSLNKGIKAFDGEEDFLVYSFYAEKNVEDVKTRLNLSVADDSFISSSAQFSLGGMSSVRGYTEGLISGDTGYNISVELSKDLNTDKSKLTYFFDYGRIIAIMDKNNQNANHSQIYSAGCVFNIKAKENDIDMVFAYPMKEHEYFDESGIQTSVFIKRKL